MATRLYEHRPGDTLDADVEYVAEIGTNAGDLSFVLDRKAAPQAVNNFVFLAREHFYDGLTFHRLAQGLFVAGGAPRRLNSDGAGYDFVAEAGPDDGLYRRGTLAMCAGPDRRISSQFFIALNDFETQTFYPVLGHVTGGTAVLDRLAAWEQAQNEAPSPAIVITRITVRP